MSKERNSRHCFPLGCLDHVLFVHILVIICPTEFHTFQRSWNHQPVVIVSRDLPFSGSRTPTFLVSQLHRGWNQFSTRFFFGTGLFFSSLVISFVNTTPDHLYLHIYLLRKIRKSGKHTMPDGMPWSPVFIGILGYSIRFLLGITVPFSVHRFLLNLHGQRRPIFFSRHGQSEYNLLGKIGDLPFFVSPGVDEHWGKLGYNWKMMIFIISIVMFNVNYLVSIPMVYPIISHFYRWKLGTSPTIKSKSLNSSVNSQWPESTY